MKIYKIPEVSQSEFYGGFVVEFWGKAGEQIRVLSWSDVSNRAAFERAITPLLQEIYTAGSTFKEQTEE